MHGESFVRLLVAASLAGLTGACCVDEEAKAKCKSKVDKYSRPGEPACFFDPFENDNITNRQMVTYTWEQARNVCLSLNATLPLVFTKYGTRLLREAFISRNRYWIGLRRNASGGAHEYIDLPERNLTAIKPGLLNYTNWAKYEPNNAGCVEDCAFMNYDGTWNDYACNFVPFWDKCDDVIHTICHDSKNPECIVGDEPIPQPLASDWYIILAITFGGIIGVVMLIISVRFIQDQCSELRK